MNKLIAYGAALVFSLASGNIAMAKSSPDGDIKGTYNCQLTGGFILQFASSALAQFTVDGKGNVTSRAGELAVTLGANLTPSTPTNGVFFSSQYSFEACQYTPSGGSYSTNANGIGTLTIDWTASGTNAATPADCTENITAHYDILINSEASLLLNSTDLATEACNSTIDYASCGSNLTGTCQQQSPKP
jgi:hypothetical protein